MAPMFARNPPPWWPKGEPFPPTDKNRALWRRANRGFFLRTVLLFSLLFVVGISLGTALIWWLAFQIDLLPLRFASHFPPGLPFPEPPIPPRGFPGVASGFRPFGTIPFIALLIFGAGLWVSVRATRVLRRATDPMRALILAASQVQSGDYTARVLIPERGSIESKALATAFNDMTAKLQQNELARRNLLADVTHELRTPLTVIQGNLEGVLDGVYERDDVHIATILEETQIMSRLVDDLRTLTLAESGSLKLQIESCDIVGLLKRCIASYETRALQMNIALTVDTTAESLTCDLDPVRIREVLNNLIDNALRYTSPSGRIICAIRNVPGDRDRIEITIQDTGSGIAPELLSHVFDRFAKDRGSHGSGLGLAIARQLVQAHGGAISASSTVGAGTTMTITLPVLAT